MYKIIASEEKKEKKREKKAEAEWNRGPRVCYFVYVLSAILALI